MKNFTLLLLAMLCAATFNATANGLVESRVRGVATLNTPTETVISTRIREQVAITVTTQTFVFSDSLTTNIRYGMPIPTHVTVTGVRYMIAGKWHGAVMKTSDTSITNPIGGGGQSATSRFLDAVGVTGFVFSLRDSIRGQQNIVFELTTVELLPYTSGRVTYSYPLNVLRSLSVTHCTWTLDIRTTRKMTDIVVGTMNVERERTDTTLKLANGLTRTTKDLAVSYDQAVDSLAVTIMSSKSEGADGYALLLAVPNTGSTGNILPKRFTFVVDRSGSMGVEKMNQAKQAALYCIERVSPFDEVNVIDFDSQVTTLFTQPLPATSANLDACRQRITSLYSRGGTEITMALQTTFGTYKDSAMVNVVVFLTDGISSISFDALRLANRHGTRVFVFGVGSDVNEGDLRRLASEHRGELEVIRNIGAVTDRIASLYGRIKDPIVKNPTLAFSPAVMYDLAPLSIPDIYAGEQLAVAGRYTKAGIVEVTLAGTNVNGAVRNVFFVDLANDDTTAPFVPKIWARLRINALLELMSRVQVNSTLWREYRDEIVRLGSTFGLITPYTTYEQGPRDDGPDVTSVQANDGPVSGGILEAFPNPVQAYTKLSTSFDLPHNSVRVVITDMQGRIILELDLGACAAGEWSHLLSISGIDGMTMASGSYVVTVSADSEIRTTTLLIVQ
ncbi:MAG: VWA domain-containing protein [Candidatus Kapabacteria bacterium]|nr:VWA domain-containing protein [Candidatus Kapabacteria bacterium]